MWLVLLLLLSKSKRELFSLILSNIINISISILMIVIGIKGLLEGDTIGSSILLGIGLLVGAITVYMIQKTIKRIRKEKTSL